jgi:cobalt-zinc-cadmium efflux system membrane fusion protein
MKTVAAILAILLIACNQKEPVTAQAIEKSTQPETGATQLTLEPAAQQRAGIHVEEVRTTQTAEVIRVTGRLTLNANRTWTVGAITDGRVVSVHCVVGDRLIEGQVLARMHSHEVHEARALYRKAVAEMARLKSAVDYSRGLRDRARRLLELKAGSLEHLERTEADLLNAQSAVSQAGLEVDRARTHLVDFLGVPAEEPENHKPGEHPGEEDLIPVRSPAAGVLMEKKVTPGTVVSPAGDMFVVSDLSAVWMVAAAPEEILSRIRVGMPVAVTVQAYPGRKFMGRIGRIGDELDASTRTAQARVDLANPAGLLKPEMYAEAEIQLGARRPAIYLSELSLQEIKGQATVFVRRGETVFEAVAVQTQPAGEGRVEVLAGLAEGDKVVTRGAFILKSQLLRSSLAEE